MIKVLSIFSLTVLLSATASLRAQPPASAAMLKPVRGPLVSFGSLTPGDTLILVCFWSAASDAGIEALDAINAQYAGWKKRARFRMLAVAEDEGRGSGRIRGLKSEHGWTFDVYEDINGELRAAAHIRNLPSSVIITGGKVVYQMKGFEKGAEAYLFDKILAMQP